jgi:uncharacterized protein YkwD
MYQFGDGRDSRLGFRATMGKGTVQNANSREANTCRGLIQLGLGLSSVCLIGLGVFSPAPSQARHRIERSSRGQEQMAALPRQQQRSRSMSELRAYALELVNRERQARGLAPLVSDPIADRAAQFHAQDMLRRRYYDHLTPEGLQPRQRYLNQGGASVALIGENLYLLEDPRRPSLSFNLASQFQRGWMRSRAHRETILMRDFSGFGYGIVAGPGGRIYAVQVFTAAPENNTRAAK